ncbi:MAG: ROK family protein [Bacteroidales bacterium]|jgi:glucokinase|nr:ROK family protein [Bacteroidales bacterium]MDD2264068.1 ROK family protein [Bacteroidales bacterium]MDD2831302.1 ROK family protein [Bacteroidales bacterium]MDD3208585.1 ROK family protein [Bacteroidales bacterium]MDD3697148.1 ROK family protein [Bacteroidales bacterium]
MQAIGVDLGGTKLHAALFSLAGEILLDRTVLLEGRTGNQVAGLITAVCNLLLKEQGIPVEEEKKIGICVPGIADNHTDRVWAPNIPGWGSFPLKEYITGAIPNTEVIIASDRTCYILGEASLGVARGCSDAIFMSIGTGIGAGIMTDGRVIHGSADIAGAVGWMAMQPPFVDEYSNSGCLETYASGTGIAAQARKLSGQPGVYPDARSVFEAYERGNTVALRVIDKAVELWGMAAANLVSIFNPSKVIWGGGVFGPAVRFLDRIYYEACKWAQPISIRQCRFEASGLAQKAGILGAGRLALEAMKAYEEK